MSVGTAKKIVPSGHAVGGWWRRAWASLVDSWLGVFVIMTSFIPLLIVIGGSISRAISQTKADVSGAWSNFLLDPATSQLTAEELVRGTIKDFQANLHLSAFGKVTIVVVVALVIWFYIYNHIVRVSRKGRTFGDQLLGLYRVDNTGHFLPLRTAFYRGGLLFGLSLVTQILTWQSSTLLGVLGNLAGLFTLVNVLWPLFDKHGQTLIEKIVGAYVTHPDRFGFALTEGGSVPVDIIFEELTVGEMPIADGPQE